MSSGLRSFAVVIKSRKLISLRQNVHSNRQKPNNCGFVVNENFIQHMHILFGHLQSLSNQNQIKNDLFAFYYLRVPELIVVSVRSCFWDWLSASAKKNQPGNAASSSFQSFFFSVIKGSWHSFSFKALEFWCNLCKMKSQNHCVEMASACFIHLAYNNITLRRIFTILCAEIMNGVLL